MPCDENRPPPGLLATPIGARAHDRAAARGLDIASRPADDDGVFHFSVDLLRPVGQRDRRPRPDYGVMGQQEEELQAACGLIEFAARHFAHPFGGAFVRDLTCCCTPYRRAGKNRLG